MARCIAIVIVSYLNCYFVPWSVKGIIPRMRILSLVCKWYGIYEVTIPRFKFFAHP